MSTEVPGWSRLPVGDVVMGDVEIEVFVVIKSIVVSLVSGARRLLGVASDEIDLPMRGIARKNVWRKMQNPSIRKCTQTRTTGLHRW